MQRSQMQVTFQELCEDVDCKAWELQPDYQREEDCWKPKHQKLFIDSCLRNYPVPPIYLHKKRVEDEQGVRNVFDVPDGIQRIGTARSFHNGEFKFVSGEYADVGEHVIQGLGYYEIPLSLKHQLDNYRFHIEVISNVDDDTIADFFARMQHGVKLTAQENRNAILGAIRDYIRQYKRHALFDYVDVTTSRFSDLHIISQLVFLAVNKFEGTIKNQPLDEFYRTYAPSIKEIQAPIAKFQTLLAQLTEALSVLPKKSTRPKGFRVERHDIHGLYLVLADCAHDSIPFDAGVFSAWIERFINDRIFQKTAVPEDKWSLEWRQYFFEIAGSTDTEDSLTARRKIMGKHLRVFLNGYKG